MALQLNTDILGSDYVYGEPYPVFFEVPPQLSEEDLEGIQQIEAQAETAKAFAQAAVAGF